MKTEHPISNKQTHSQFGLLKTRRFAPFFWTQFMGAFNDNLFKNALALTIVYKIGSTATAGTHLMVNIAAGIFILPFFLFSATAGQLADKYEKSALIRRVKLAEIVIMGGAVLGFYFNSIPLLMVALFLMGGQSSFFGPVKYSILPQHLKADEIVGGNALVETGTFVAILMGTIAGGVLIQQDHGGLWVGAIIVLVAVFGYLGSLRIPSALPTSSNLKVNWNPLSQTWETLRSAYKDRPIFLSILALSWFWFLGAAYLAQFPAYTRHVLGGDEGVVTLLLGVFAVGIGVGSLLCENLSGRKVELGLVPLGALGISAFGFDLSHVDIYAAGTTLLPVNVFLNTPGALHVLTDLFLIGVCGGLYSVPLFTFVQVRTRPDSRARIIAANNILNAFLMVMSALCGVLLLSGFSLSIPQFFGVMAITNLLVAIYIFKQLPVFVVRFLVWIITHTMYRIKKQDLDQIPAEGAAVLVCNHITYMDAFIIGGACRRPIRFVMYGPYFNMPVLKSFFRVIGAIPIVPKRKDPVMYERAFDEIADALEAGELVCIFPEGGLTRNGETDRFRPGIEKIIQRNPVPVIPLALRGLWGSFFSHKNGAALTRFPRRFWSKIELVVGAPLHPRDVSAGLLQENVVKLRGNRL